MVAKRLGGSIKERKDWEEVKVLLMSYLVVQKFAQEPFKTWLLETGDEELVEGNTWGDTFWGVCKGEGENQLGIILMGIRSGLSSNG